MSSTATATGRSYRRRSVAESAPPAASAARLIRLVVVLLVSALAWLVGFSSVLAARTVTGHRYEPHSTPEVDAAAVPLGRRWPGRTSSDRRRIADAAAGRDRHGRPQLAGHDAITVAERSPVLAVRQPTAIVLVDTAGVGLSTEPSIPKGCCWPTRPGRPAAAARGRRGRRGPARASCATRSPRIAARSSRPHRCWCWTPE